MKKFIVLILIVAFFMISVGCTTISNNASEPDGDGMGPAPNSGDGISDGNGFVDEVPSFGDGLGGAPNSGDGISDGSGFDDTGADR